MAQVVTCPHCQGQCAVEDEHIGMRLKCPRCDEQFTAGGGPEDAPEAGGRTPSRRRSAPVFQERGSALERARDRAGRESGMEKYFVVGVLVVVVFLMILMVFGFTGQKKPNIHERHSLEEQEEMDPKMRERRRFEEERKRYYQQQEQTPGAKKYYEKK